MSASPVYVLGDIHGQHARLISLLKEAALLSADLSWQGGTAQLWLLGDYFDRGPGGITCLDLIMRLQPQAAASGGLVGALLGNHDVLLLAALFFGDQPSTGAGGTFFADWLNQGGSETDLDNLELTHIEWLLNLPAMALVDGYLLAHADARFYLRYGHSVAQVNRGLAALLHGREAAAWDGLLSDFNQRRYFWDPQNGADNARTFLEIYGASQLIHGHTPISRLTGRRPDLVREPLVYADCLCVNVDGGMYLGGPGFMYRLGDE